MRRWSVSNALACVRCVHTVATRLAVQVAEEGIKFLPPTQGEAVVQSMMNLSIVFLAWKSKKPTSKLVGFSKAWGDIPGSNR